MLETLQLIEQISSLRSTVLIQGESGTGKELVARAIHCSGKRAAKPFVSVPCAALAETLLESELFGYEKGAFTGAGSQTKGKFELADGGTLVLDEIGDIPPKLQADLLRVLQERCFYRVGGNDEVVVDVRIIAATNRNLKAAVREGSFREDLFYRVNVIGIRLPPLRERREDIPLLARYFMERLTREMNRPVEDLSEGAVRLLMAHDWPGNVRELENAIERAIVVCRERVLGEEHFEFLQKRDRSQGWSIPEHMTLKEIEKRAIVTTLERTGGNIKESAAILGIDRSTLYEKIKRYAIPVRRGR
jgi:transcriptional regulator with PAS, ATPase and Fis domain